MVRLINGRGRRTRSNGLPWTHRGIVDGGVPKCRERLQGAHLVMNTVANQGIEARWLVHVMGNLGAANVRLILGIQQRRE